MRQTWDIVLFTAVALFMLWLVLWVGLAVWHTRAAVNQDYAGLPSPWHKFTCTMFASGRVQTASTCAGLQCSAPTFSWRCAR